ncbi:MAG: histidinol dehydrogenase, partial [Bosea sp. (in: a-proteobacteria)]
MAFRFDTRDDDFPSAFAHLLAMRREVPEDVDKVVAAIIEDVRARGDMAVIDYTQRFDRLSLTPETLRVSADEIASAVKACPPAALAALRFAHARIMAFHERQKPADWRGTDASGVEAGWRWTAIEAVGLYVPGGTASYPSSVLMNAVPAKVAGCPRIVMVAPAPDGVLNPLVLAAADLAGVDEIYR